MEQTYFVYLGDNGWWGQNGTATSELKDAKSFSPEEALAFCRRRYDRHNRIMSAVPVNSQDILEITSR